MIKINENKKYKILSIIRYLGDGFFYPFFSRYLISTGLAEAKIGFILSISPLLAILMNPIYSKICKDINKTKKVLSIITILEGIMIVIIGFSNNFYLISILTLFMAIFGSCHYGLMDSLTAVYCDNVKINYSSIRVFGSSSYIISTAIGGYVCDLLGYDISFIISACLFILSGVIYKIICPIILDSKDDEIDKVKIIDVIKNNELIYFMIFYCLLMGTTSSTDYFFSVYLESRGITASQYGLIYSYFVIFEVVLLIMLNKFVKKKSPHILLLIASICLFIRMLVNYLYLPVILVVILSGLRGIGYACILHVSFQYVIDIVGKKKATIGIMICTLAQSIYVFIFNNINGNIIEKSSYKMFYFINIIITVIILIMAIIRVYKYKNKKIS